MTLIAFIGSRRIRRVRGPVTNAILLANIAVLVLLLGSGTASAQNGIFDTILGRRAAPRLPRRRR